jgi:hypothetical protein
MLRRETERETEREMEEVFHHDGMQGIMMPMLKCGGHGINKGEG